MAHGHDDFHHIRDFPYLELPGFLGGNTESLPKISLPWGEMQLTKFMVLQVVAGLLVLFIFAGLSWHIRGGRPARGWFWNFWEMLAVAIRDYVVRPTIGEGHDDHGHGDSHDTGHGDHGHGSAGHAVAVSEEHKPSVPEQALANLNSVLAAGYGSSTEPVAKVPMGAHPADKYLPYVWTCFFYVLFCNLLGALPWLGAATGHLSVTSMLALVTLVVVVWAGAEKLGFLGFFQALIPSMDLPGPIGPPLKLLIWCIEFLGLIVKHCVLAMRLFLNIMAGHTVLGVILAFIAAAAAPDFPSPVLWWLITPASVFGQVFIGMLELFVAFLQAYVFAFLTTLFISMAVHPH